MLKLANYDTKEFDKTDTFANRSIFPPQASLQGYRCLICGPSGSGKTNVLMNLLLNKSWGLTYDKLYIISPSVNYQPKYLKLRQEMGKIDDKKRAEIRKIRRKYKTIKPEEIEELERRLTIPTAEVYEDFSDMKDFSMENIPDDEVTVFVFDDVVLNKNQAPFVEIFSKGWHRKINCMYLTQRYYTTDKMLRANCNYFMLFAGLGDGELCRHQK